MMKLLLGTHAEVREFLIDFLEDKLPALKKYQFQMHLLLCKDCENYLGKYRSSIDLSKNYLADPPPPELVDLTLKFIEEKLEEKKKENEPGTYPSP